MNKYTKGRNVEEEWSKNNIPFTNLPDDFVWMRVSAGAKIRSLLEAAWNQFNNQNCTHIVWSGSGAAVSKVITCAEITKRKFSRDTKLEQITKICYRKTEEYWDPKPEYDYLDQLVVVRNCPAIHIALWKDQPSSSS